MNYSPHNYIFRSDVDGNCENIYSRNTDVYTVSVDRTEQINGTASIKFVGAAAADGKAPYTYEYYYKQASQSAWTKKNVDSNAAAATVKPSKAVPYNIKVVVKDAADTTAEKEFRVTVNPAETPLVNNSTASESVTLGENITVKGSATGGTAPYKYEYYFKQASQTAWTKKNVENTVTSTTVKPGKAGAYNIKVVVTDSNGKTAEKVFEVAVNSAEEPLVNSSAVTTSIKLGDNITVIGSASGGTAPYKYEYYFKQAWQKI